MRIGSGVVALAALMWSVMGLPASSSATRATAWKSACQEAIASHSQVQCNQVKVFGHRAAIGPATGTNENTLWALRKDHRHRVGCETDTWRLASNQGVPAQGTPVIFHDPTLGRVVSSGSLDRAGLTPTTHITTVRLKQFRLLRTKGGQPLPTLREWLDHEGRWHVPCKVELKGAPARPSRIAGWVERYQAPATFYGQPWISAACSQQGVLSMLTVGLTVGLKYNTACPMTMQQIAQAGYSYTTWHSPTATVVQNAHAHGLHLGVSSGSNRDYWAALVELGVDFIIAPHPGHLRTWLRG